MQNETNAPGSYVVAIILGIIGIALFTLDTGENWGLLQPMLALGFLLGAIASSPLPALVARSLGWDRRQRRRWLGFACTLVAIPCIILGLIGFGETMVDSEKPEELKMARHLMQLGAAAKIPYTMHNLGILYRKDTSGDDSAEKSFAMYQRAADMGYADSQEYIALRYYKGDGVPKDYVQAVNWFRKAADGGNSEALNNLGVAYHYGQGVDTDYARAFDYYTQSADKGFAMANGGLAVIYREGHGRPVDAAKARGLFKIASDAGDTTAQLNLGAMLYDGAGGERDVSEARRLFSLAAHSDDPDTAKMARDNLELP